MDYEKKYKEALENARQEYNTTENVERKQWLEELFPELIESEDERIRKTLIHYVENWKTYNPNSPFDDYAVYTSDRDECDRILAWLEKQGKQKPTNEEMKIILRTEYEKGKADAIAEMQKPAWSEEDEKMLKDTIRFCELCGNQVSANWLKSLKDIVQPQPKQEWSEEDETIADNLAWAVANDKIRPQDRDDYCDWLKSLKGRVQPKHILHKTHTIFDQII